VVSQLINQVADNPSMTSVIVRPELPKRLLWIVVTLIFGLPVIGLLSDPMPSDAAWWFFLVMCIAIAGVAARSLFIRVVADEDGVRVVSTLSSRHYRWDSITRFEGPPQSRFVVLVMDTGERRRLPGLRQSPGEQLRDRPSHTEDAFERLQGMLQDR
jgi:hypothetical protein